MASRRAFLTNLGGLAVVAGGAWLLRDRVLLTGPKVSAPAGVADSGWLPFAAPALPVVTVDAQIGGRPIKALVDSGAQISVIDQALAAGLGANGASVPVVTMGVEGRPSLGRTLKVDVQLGSLSVQGLSAAVLDLAHVEALGAGRFSAILGDNVLSALVADIDFPRRRIAFHQPQGYRPPAGAVAVPARVEDRRLMASITLAGAPMEVVLDTGASAVVALSRRAAEARGLLRERTIRQAPSLSLNGVAMSGSVNVDEVRFAGQAYRDVQVQLYDAAQASVLPQGLLGYGALRRFRVIINRSAGQLHLLRPDV